MSQFDQNRQILGPVSTPSEKIEPNTNGIYPNSASSPQTLHTEVKSANTQSSVKSMEKVLASAKAELLPEVQKSNHQLKDSVANLVYAAKSTLDTSSYVLVGTKRAQRNGIEGLEHQFAAAVNDYDDLYDAYSKLQKSHSDLINNLQKLLDQATTDEQLIYHKEKALREILEVDNLGSLREVVKNLSISEFCP
jgi:hypothetical protein